MIVKHRLWCQVGPTQTPASSTTPPRQLLTIATAQCPPPHFSDPFGGHPPHRSTRQEHTNEICARVIEACRDFRGKRARKDLGRRAKEPVRSKVTVPHLLITNLQLQIYGQPAPSAPHASGLRRGYGLCAAARSSITQHHREGTYAALKTRVLAPAPFFVTPPPAACNSPVQTRYEVSTLALRTSWKGRPSYLY